MGKGKAPKNPDIDLYGAYKALWARWAVLNPHMLTELREHAQRNGNRLCDMFGTTPVTQARALADLLNA